MKPCIFHDWRYVEALPLEYGGQGAIHVPYVQRCAKCGAERRTSWVRWAIPAKPCVQAPAVPYPKGGAPVQLPLFGGLLNAG